MSSEASPPSQTTASEHPAPNLSVAALDEAVDIILKHNFDADSKLCFITLMKVLDNVIQKPYDAKVRSIRLTNPAFSKKVASRRGGVEFLLACGFVKESPPPPLLARGNSGEPQDSFLVLNDDNIGDTTHESQRQARKQAYTSHIITARRLLMTRAIQELNLKADELPPYKPPPPLVALDSNASNTATSSSAAAATASFNPYQPQRYDGMSAAVGAQLTPDATYESTTEKQLKTLQQQQQKLEQKLQKELVDRQWVASHPNASGKPTANLNTNDDAMDIDNNDNNKGTAGLIAAQFQKQQAAKKQREEGGFTTKSMRELERLKKQKVYSHTQLALQFSDGTVLQGKFLPKETIQTVMEAVADCFLQQLPPTKIEELYVTPPRQTLSPKATLQQEGLVPAAKVFVKVALPDYRPFLKPELFAASPEQLKAAFPESQPIVADANKSKDSNNKDDNDSKPAAKPKVTTAEDKEEALMRRMMGGGRRLGGGAGANNNNKNNTDAATKKAKPSSGKPKWFK